MAIDIRVWRINNLWSQLKQPPSRKPFQHTLTSSFLKCSHILKIPQALVQLWFIDIVSSLKVRNHMHPNKYRQQHDFECNLVLVSMSKFSQDNKIAQVVRVSAICSFWKINISYLHQTAHKIVSILITNSPVKNITELRIDIAHATCNSHLCHNFALMLQLWTCFLVLHEKCTHFQPIRRVRVFHVYY